MLRNKEREHGGQQHEHQRLNQADEQLHEVERNLNEPADARHSSHRFEHRFAGKDVSVQTKAERDGAEQNRDDLQAARSKEHDDHEGLQDARGRALGRKELLEEPDGTEIAKNTSAIASVRLTSALAPRKKGCSSWNPSGV